MNLTKQEYVVLDRLVQKAGCVLSEDVVKVCPDRRHIVRKQKTESFIFRPQCEYVNCKGARPEKVDRWIASLDEEIRKSRTGPNLSRLISEFLGGRNPAEVYKKIGMSRQTFNNIRASRGSGKHQKAKVLQLIIGLELDLGDAERLLAATGLSFSAQDPTDVIVRFCIKNRKLDPFCVDQALARYSQPALFSMK